MREIKRWLTAAVALMTVLGFSPAAHAGQSPEGCLGTEPTVTFPEQTLAQTGVPVRDGDSIVLGASISNQGASACDLSDISVQVRLPNPDGSPGQYRQIASNVSLAAGAAVEGFTEVDPYVVDLDEGVFQAPLEISWQATVHSGPNDPTIGGTGTGTKITVTRPRVRLKVTPDPTSGTSPFTVTNTYRLTNISPAATTGLDAPGLIPSGAAGSRDALGDETCSPVTYVSGDDSSDADPVLDPGETWTFSCVRTWLLPGVYQSQPSITGNSNVDGRPWPGAVADAEITPLKVLGSDLVVDKSHVGDLLAGSTGEYQLKVTNSGTQASSDIVTVADQLPYGLTGTAISGDGWSCDLSSLSCSRSDALGPGSSYPDVTVSVSVANEPPDNVVNTATVSGGDEPLAATGNNSDEDPTTIRTPGQPQMPTSNKFTVTRLKSRNNGSVAVTVSVPGAGRLRVDDAVKPDLVTSASKKTVAIGSYTLVVKAGKRLRRKLKKSHASRPVKLKITFKPTGGRRASKKRTAVFRVR